MKKSIKLILALAVLILLIVALKLIPAVAPSNPEATAPAGDDVATDTDFEVFTLKAEDLDAVTVTEGDKSITYLPPKTENGDWSIKDFSDFKSNLQAVNYRLSQMIALTATQKIEATNLSEYGLDHPSKTVTYEMKDHTTKKLLVGNMTLDNICLYAMVEGDDSTIYLLRSSYDNCISADLATFNDSTLSDFDPNSFSITSMQFSGKDFSPVEIKLSPTQNGTIAWYDFSLDNYKDVSASFTTVEAIKALFPSFKVIQNYVASNVTDISQYGLDDPSFHLVINYSVQNTSEDSSVSTQSTETLDLTFGNTLDDSNVAFIVGDDTSNVYSMNGNFIEKIKALLTPFSLCNKYLAIPNINDVKTIKVDFAESNASYDITVDHANETYSCNGVAVENTNFRALYRSIIGIAADKQLEESEDNKNASPVVTIKYTLNDGTTNEVKYMASSNNQYYQTYLYDQILVGCSKVQFTTLQENLEHAIKGEAITDNF